MGGRMNRTSKKRESRKITSKAAASKEEAGSGVAALKETANLAVARNSEGIAESLLQGALAGNVSSTKLLLSLAEGAVSVGDKGPLEAKVSMASIWAAEPQWQGEISEWAAEAGPGSREPES
jgi:hypothetical protein